MGGMSSKHLKKNGGLGLRVYFLFQGKATRNYSDPYTKPSSDLIAALKQPSKGYMNTLHSRP